MRLAFGGRVAVIALTIIAGIDAAGISVPNIDASIGDWCAGPVLDDAQDEIERCAGAAFGAGAGLGASCDPPKPPKRPPSQVLPLPADLDLGAGWLSPGSASPASA